MELSSALAQEGVTRVSSYVSAKIDDKVSRAEIITRLEMALSRLAFVLEKTSKMPITYVSLVQRRKILKGAYIEGTYLLNKHKPRLLEEGREDNGKVVVRRSLFYLQWIASSIANMPISSLLGLNNVHYLSSSVARKFEWYADCADKFVADAESVSPLRRDTFFRCPFGRQLFEGKYLSYTRTKGSQELLFDILPVISEWRGGIEAWLWYKYFDPEKLDKSLDLWVMLRLSESTDIVGIARNCLRSSASLLNLEAQDAMGELILLSSLQQEISSPYDAHVVDFQEFLALYALLWRSDPVCCHANVHKPGVDQGIISSDLTHIFPEQVIYVHLTRYMLAAEHCSLPGASDKAGRTRNVRMMDRPPTLELKLSILPHHSPFSLLGECSISRVMGNTEEIRSPYGSIEQTIDAVRSEAIDCLIRQPEAKNCSVIWCTNHGSASLDVERQSTDTAAVSKASGRYSIRSSAKRKRQ